VLYNEGYLASSYTNASIIKEETKQRGKEKVPENLKVVNHNGKMVACAD